MKEVLASARSHPTPAEPFRGVFNRRSLKHIANTDDITFSVLSPQPVSPPIGPYSKYSKIPQEKSYPEYIVRYPRFLYLIPRRYFKYNITSWSFKRTAEKYLQELDQTPDIAHACHIHFDGYGLADYCEENDIPLLVVAHGAAINSYDSLPVRGQRMIKSTLERASSVVTVSEALEQKASRLTDRSKITTVGLGAQPEHFPCERETSIRRSLEIPNEHTVVLFCGQFSERKGIPEICSTLRDIDLEEVTFIFVGHRGSLRSELEAAARVSEVDDVRILHEVPTELLRKYFAIADLLLLPSYSEGRPTVIYEAMASRTAVLSTLVGGIPEQVADDITGELIEPGNESRLKNSLEKLCNDPDRLSVMGERGHQRLVENGWTWEGHAKKIHGIYEDLLNK